MKNYLTNLFNSSIFRYVQRIAVACVLLSFALTATAGGEWKGTAYAYAKFAESSSVANGVGKVYVGTSETPTYKNLSEVAEMSKSTANNSDDPKNVDFWWAATAEVGTNSAFAGWFTDAEASTKHKDEAKFKASVQVNKDPDKKGSLTFYAHFRKVIDAPVEVAWTKTTETATTTFDVNLYKAEKFRVKSFAHKDGLSRTFSAEVKAEDLSDQKAKITMSAGADVVDGDIFNVVLTTDNGGDVLVLVKIVSKITVRFELPKRGQGYYEAIQLNYGGNVTYNSKVAGEARDVNLTDTRQFFQQITAYPADGYRLYRWIVRDKDGNTTYPTTNPLEHRLNEGDVISVEFLPTGLAQFMVKDDPDKKLFYELDGDNGAFKHAEKLGKKVVVVQTSGTLYTEYKSLTNSKYEFTIPAGYTLLVPGDDAYTVVKNYNNTAPWSSEIYGVYRELILPANTRIINKGDICLFSFLYSYTPPVVSIPTKYGKLKMLANTEIILEDKSQLTAFGYVVGDPTNSEIIAKSGSTVYEALQMTGWRGGSFTLPMVENEQRVFPISQYYVQNIETKLTYRYGAIGKIVSIVTMNVKVDNLELPIDATFIGPKADDDAAEDKGFLCIGPDTELSKWYDGEKDRQMYEIVGTANGDSRGKVKFGIINLNMDLPGWASILLGGNLNISSIDYVLPISSNISVNLKNIELIAPYELALLAGSELYIDAKSTVNVSSNLFVYDKEQNFYNADLTKGYFGSLNEPLHQIPYTAYHYDKYLSDKTTYSYLSGGKPYASKNTYIRTSSNIEDAKITVDGTVIVAEPSNTSLGSGIYTTIYNEGTDYNKGTSTDLAKYGANITSNGGGKIDFQKIGTKQFTYQVYQSTEASYIKIPITNARLRNADNSWSAGDTLTTKDEYTYSLEKGRWVTPQEISFVNWNNNKWLVRLPEPGTVTQTVEISLSTKEILTMDNFEIEWPANAYFAKGGNATYDAENKKLLVPITYTLTKVHNKDVEPNAYVGSLVVKCKDLNVTGDVVAEANIPLTAVEDYTPEFTVTINGVPVTTGDTYDFGQTYAQVPVEVNLVITPIDTTVAKLPAIQWSVVATGSFDATPTKVIYYPQTKSADEGESGTLTIIATYSDAATPPNLPACTLTVNLQGKAVLQESTLQFRDDLTTEIYQADKITDVFSDLGNLSDVTFTYAYTDGTPANDLMVESKQNGNYTLTANTTDYVDNRVVVVTATQGATDVMAGASRPLTVTIKPVVAWNWSTLYFNTERYNPVTVARTGDWTLTEVEGSDPNNLVAVSGVSPNYSAIVGTGDASQVYTAKFKFVQGAYEKEFTSSIYADPRALGFCVDYVRQFNDVSTPTETTVTFDENSHKTTFRPGDKWEINMTGMPDKLTFTATGNNRWYIGERASSSTNYSDVVAWSKLSGTQIIQLKPTTNQVIIQYGAGDDNGTITNLCISELEISADKDAIYFPINKDGSETTDTLILTHTEPTKPMVSLDSHFTTTLSAVSNNLGTTPEEPYYQTTVTISGDMSAVEKGSYVLTATQGTAKITIPVHADEFPQGLPIKLATDDAKRYHFVAVEEDKVTWDETTKHVVFQTPEGEQTIRSVTFAFEGAPSRIKFTASQDIIDNQWRVDESADGSEFVTSGLANRDTEAGTKFVHNLQYTTRYVRVVYNSENKSEIELSDLVIEGDPMLLVNPEELEFSTDDRNKSLTLTAINLNNIRIELDNVTDFQMSHGAAEASATYTLSSADYPNALGVNKVGDIEIKTEWITNSIVNDGMITIYNVDENDSILAKVKLVGAGKYLHRDDAKITGLYTGIPDGTRDTDGDGNPNTEYKYTYHGADYTAYQYHPVDLSKTFAEDGTALFDYLFVYGETTTTDGSKDITAPKGENGSNARTPYYVYIRDVDAYGNFDRYRFVTMLDNANIGNKQDLHVQGVTTNDSSLYINIPKDAQVRVYIAGFCPYASIGADKFQEGVFFFRGMAGSKLDVYLEDAHIFARNKMLTGQPFYARGSEAHKEHNPKFTEGYARGSGGVLVFENMESTEDLMQIVPFEVTIHTIGNNLLKSNYGCFNYFFGMDPYQISAPIHVRLHSAKHVRTSKTTLNFTDEWPLTLNADRTVASSKRTNGFLSLQKLNNNAPSIDLGNPLTEVNFRGGQVQLQNAQIVSENYKTTLAISYRSGEYGGDKVGLKFAYGIGTDSVGGSVNFYDGTITVLPMKVAAAYQQYYLMDPQLDADGDTIRDANDNVVYSDITTCLRTPKNTNVYGGSICWLRACQHVTSKGGAPSDGTGKLLGQYIYEFGGDDTKDDATGLVTSIKFPGNVEGLAAYYNIYHPDKPYGINSITPDADNKLYFWIPEGYGGVSAEKDNILTTWKACMTEISAGFGTLNGTVGGPTPVEQSEEIRYMLYCKIDENIRDVITAGEGEGINRIYSYSAPVKVPPVAQGYVGGTYTSVTPSMVGMELQNEVLSDTSYMVTDRVYYVTNATADLWQTFTAPFDVEKIWVVETFSEEALKQVGDGKRDTILISQAHHNADFAAFFGVSMAIGTTDSLGAIFNDFVEWGKLEDQKGVLPDGTPKPVLYNGVGDYTLRGRYELIPYYTKADGSANWAEANFYLNENKGNWQLSEDGFNFNTNWTMLTEAEATDGILLEKGKTYSMMFPFCTGCGDDLSSREYWDYWSGKFLIFESTDGTKTGGHIIDGSNLFDSIPFATDPDPGYAIVSGNSTFSYIETSDPDVYTYQANFKAERFMPNRDFETQEALTTQIMPTTAFLWTNLYTPSNVRVRSVARTGEIDYVTDENPDDNGDGTTTGGNIPTVGGGNDLFITETANGINIAVSEAQHVRVMSATGILLFNGMVQTAVDVALPANGVYVIAGENEVHKILH